MDSKPLIYGLIGFFIGGFIVSVAATTFEKPLSPDSMSAMTSNLKDKSGDAFDEEFVSQMIVHHQGAVEMARLAENQAKHDEIKQLSKDIIAAQEGEIKLMQDWQRQWDYKTSPQDHPTH